MNVDDFFLDVNYSRFCGLHLDYSPEYQKIIGFIPCNRDYMHASLSKKMIDDIVNNNTEYMKCVYDSGREICTNISNSLSVLTRIERFNVSSRMSKNKFKDEIFYTGPGLLMDNKMNSSADYVKNIVVSPKVFKDKSTLNKYITSKVIPAFAIQHMEVTIKDVPYLRLDAAPLSELSIKDIPNTYELCKLEFRS